MKSLATRFFFFRFLSTRSRWVCFFVFFFLMLLVSLPEALFFPLLSFFLSFLFFFLVCSGSKISGNIIRCGRREARNERVRKKRKEKHSSHNNILCSPPNITTRYFSFPRSETCTATRHPYCSKMRLKIAALLRWIKHRSPVCRRQWGCFLMRKVKNSGVDICRWYIDGRLCMRTRKHTHTRTFHSPKTSFICYFNDSLKTCSAEALGWEQRR